MSEDAREKTEVFANEIRLLQTIYIYIWRYAFNLQFVDLTLLKR